MGRNARMCEGVCFFFLLHQLHIKSRSNIENLTHISLHFLVSRIKLSQFSGTVCSRWKRCQNILTIITQKILIEHKGAQQSFQVFAADRSDAQTTEV